MNAPLAWLNGRYVPFHEAALPLHDAGFVSGATIVDNARTYARKLFRWPDHLARFRRDCEACFVPLEATDAELTEAADTLVMANAAGGDIHVVTFATPGPLGVYSGEGNGPATLGMVTYPVTGPRYRPFFTEGAVLVPVPMTVPLPGVKHRSRMHWHVADHVAKRDTGVPHALAVSANDGTIGETSIANVLAVIDGAIVSPPASLGPRGVPPATDPVCSGVPSDAFDGFTRGRDGRGPKDSVPGTPAFLGPRGVPPATDPVSRGVPDSHSTGSRAAETAAVPGMRATPGMQAGMVLAGISLKVTRELCGKLGIGFREEPIRADDPFTELMICGTGFGLAGVRRLGDRTFEHPGPLTTRLIAAWSALTNGG